ncbi:MAG: hypothetical protein EA427_04790 [Spirochaetaceae bacterium]|nr:MAG: hypothetical protein EA427_04790 [Spirochaetaceae bacterium]
MSIETIFAWLSGTGWGFPIILILVPLTTFAVSLVHGVYDGRHAPWRHIYGLVVQGTTAALLALLALIALHVLAGGAFIDAAVPRRALIYLGVCWLLSLLVVKRAVDFRHIPAVRNPLLLVLGWGIGWTAGGALYHLGLWLVPGPPLYTTVAAAIVLFGIVQMIILLPRSRR